MTIIGRKDKCDFPLLGLFDLDVKIDTGAYTSAIHCSEIEQLERDDQFFVRCKVLDPAHEAYNGRAFEFENFHVRKVKSSNGKTQERFAIKTQIVIFGQPYTTSFTLTDRADMKYPVLLGRKLLRKRFIVDTSKINLSYKMKKRYI